MTYRDCKTSHGDGSHAQQEDIQAAEMSKKGLLSDRYGRVRLDISSEPLILSLIKVDFHWKIVRKKSTACAYFQGLTPCEASNKWH
jgi:hypothetical protein